MTDTPAPTFTLPEGLPDIPHLIQRMKYWSGPSEHWPKVAREACADAASALASIPDMVAKLQALDSACAQYGCQFEKIAEKNAKLGAAAEEGKELRDINDRLRSRIQERDAEIERLKDDFQRIQSVYDFAEQAAKIDRLRSRNAELEELVKIIAARSIWRDFYPDGPDVVEVSARNDGVFFTPDQIRKARALSTEGDGTERED